LKLKRKKKAGKAPKNGSEQKNIPKAKIGGFHSHPLTKSFNLKWKTILVTLNWSATRMFGLGGEYGVQGVCSDWRKEWPGYAVLQKSVKGLKQVILAASDYSIGCFDFAEPLSVTFLKPTSAHDTEDDHEVLLSEVENDEDN